ncbi:MAG: helix-turn-helix transcriptional regulator [Pyrinomonadaceae bacterium]
MNFNKFALLEAIKERRDAERISQAELSRRTNIPQSHISRIERGIVDVQLSTLMQISFALGCELRMIPKRHVDLVDRVIDRQPYETNDKPAYSLDDET